MNVNGFLEIKKDDLTKVSFIILIGIFGWLATTAYTSVSEIDKRLQVEEITSATVAVDLNYIKDGMDEIKDNVKTLLERNSTR